MRLNFEVIDERIIMKELNLTKLTFDEAIENHRKMWNWIADETEKRQKALDKDSYFKENKLHRCYCNSYCCEYAAENSLGIMRDCNMCPIEWGNGIKCRDDGELYYQWENSVYFDNWQFAAKYAREIANLPTRLEAMK